jgi:putative ubiquitin-RnfH superfamily antitoxin RatB of RatAB toxin-antitoxin module
MLHVAVAWSARPGEAREVDLELRAGANVLDAIRASGAMTGEGAIDISIQAVGIWGRTVALDAPLAEGDRVEIYRALLMDPKEARRRRAQRRK